MLARLTNAQKLALGNNPHGSVPALLEDCLACAVDAIVAERRPGSPRPGGLRGGAGRGAHPRRDPGPGRRRRGRAGAGPGPGGGAGDRRPQRTGGRGDGRRPEGAAGEPRLPGVRGRHGAGPAAAPAPLPAGDAAAHREGAGRARARRAEPGGRRPGGGGVCRPARLPRAGGPPLAARPRGWLDDRGAAGEPLRERARHGTPGLGEAHPQGPGRAGGLPAARARPPACQPPLVDSVSAAGWGPPRGREGMPWGRGRGSGRTSSAC